MNHSAHFGPNSVSRFFVDMIADSVAGRGSNKAGKNNGRDGYVFSFFDANKAHGDCKNHVSRCKSVLDYRLEY